MQSRPLFVEHAGAHQSVHHGIRIAVRGRPTVLQVALLLLCNRTWYPNAATSVRHAYFKNKDCEMFSCRHKLTWGWNENKTVAEQSYKVGFKYRTWFLLIFCFCLNTQKLGKSNLCQICRLFTIFYLNDFRYQTTRRVIRFLPALKSLILAVSWSPVNLLSLSLPPRGSYTLMCFMCTFDNLSIAFSISL